MLDVLHMCMLKLQRYFCVVVQSDIPSLSPKLRRLWFVGDMWPRNSEEEGQEEPHWVKSEREQFVSYRDKNKDGKMDKDEVMEWIIPHDYDHSQAEAKHLIFESDVNKVDI